jgi:DNA-binding NtrC family response regulator
MPTGVSLIESWPECAGIGYVLERARLSVVQRTCWAAFDPARMGLAKAGLIVANAAAGGDGPRHFFQWLIEHRPGTPTLAIVPEGDAALIRLASSAVDDFLIGPVREDELYHRVTRLLGPPPESREELQATLIGQLGLQQLVGQDPAFVEVLERVARFAVSDAAVLVTGETGTGKELCARAIHLLSGRRGGPFIPVECGSIPEHLFENEIFGHAKGAFTDARAEQRGLVSLAQGGTLFLDEIDSLSLGVQAKLLRLLQEQTFRPLGSERFLSADLRVVAATNCDLLRLVEQKRFRADLYFRLDVLRVRLPALRERRSDVALLARHFLRELCAKEGVGHKTLTPVAVRKLESYSWPGNVRELYHAVHRAALCAAGCEVTPAHVLVGEERAQVAAEPGQAAFQTEKRRVIERFERAYVQGLLETMRGNVTQAAKAAGQDRRAFGKLAKKYGLSDCAL